MTTEKKISSKITSFSSICLVVFREMLFEQTRQHSDSDAYNARTAEQIGISAKYWLEVKNGNQPVTLQMLAGMGRACNTWPSRILTVAEAVTQSMMMAGWHVSSVGAEDCSGDCELLAAYSDYRVKRVLKEVGGVPETSEPRNPNLWFNIIPVFFEKLIKETK